MRLLTKKHIFISLMLVVLVTVGGILVFSLNNSSKPATDNRGVTPTIPKTPLLTNKMELWSKSGGPHLRGANIYQRRVYTELDGPDFMGSEPVGPPYTQKDFDRLAALGANYVQISHPGLFTEKTPYTLDKDIQENLDRLIEEISAADMFAVISFRTGPGRSEFTFLLEDAGDWFNESYLNDSMWQDQEAQDAWAKMWRYTAKRYRNNPNVIGYHLMVEPNSNEVGHDARNPLDIWDSKVFYSDYEGTLYDWNQLHPRITKAIRKVDSDTPIIIGGMAYSAVNWLPYLKPTSDSLTVYAVHQYEPFAYTHQDQDDIKVSYPGEFDTNGDGVDDQFNRSWLDNLLSTVDGFVSEYNVPVAVTEFGLVRWVPGSSKFMDDQMDLFEQRGMNYALWVWDPTWEPHRENDAFNFLRGPDPQAHTDVKSSDLTQVITKYWGYNTIRPSNMTF